MNPEQEKSPAGTPPGVAVVGSGYWGKNLVRNDHALGALKLICDNNDTLLAHFQQQYPDVETCLSLQAVRERLERQLAELYQVAERHQAQAIRCELQAIVPEYTPQACRDVLREAALPHPAPA